MTQACEVVLNKAFEEAKIESSKPGTYGRFGVYWDAKNGRPVLVKKMVEETKLLPSHEDK
jgi:hypothetical protein